MTASAAPTSPIKIAPKAHDPARRHYVSLAWRLRAALAEARATSTEPEALEDLAARFADARSMAARARAWGQRADRRARLAPARSIPVGRWRKRTMRTQLVTAREREIQVANGSVPDPYDPKRFSTVPTNRRVDPLAQERSTERITEAQFTVGRMIQAVYERALGRRASSRVPRVIRASRASSRSSTRLRTRTVSPPGSGVRSAPSASASSGRSWRRATPSRATRQPAARPASAAPPRSAPTSGSSWRG